MNYWDAYEKIKKELEEKLDLGYSRIDICIEFENRLWKMDNDKSIDKESGEYKALQTMVNVGRKTSSAAYYEQYGWKKKYSGEWVRGSKYEHTT